MHLPQHQELLRNARLHGYLDSAIEQIRQENSRAFHIEVGSAETLSQRRFFHQPATSVPMKSCVHVYVPRVSVNRAAEQQSSGASVASNSSEANDEAGALAADVV